MTAEKVWLPTADGPREGRLSFIKRGRGTAWRRNFWNLQIATETGRFVHYGNYLNRDEAGVYGTVAEAHEAWAAEHGEVWEPGAAYGKLMYDPPSDPPGHGGRT